MRKMRISDYDGFEKKPESEWTEREKMLYETHGVVPLTKAGMKAYREHLRNTPEIQRLTKFTDEWMAGVEKEDDGLETAREGGEGE